MTFSWNYQVSPPTEVFDVGETPHCGFTSPSSDTCIVQIIFLHFHSRIRKQDTRLNLDLILLIFRFLNLNFTLKIVVDIFSDEDMIYLSLKVYIFLTLSGISLHIGGCTDNGK